MTLTEKQKRHLRGLGHSLKPVVQTGNAGLTEAVLAEAERAIDHHELIKVRLMAADHAERDAMIQTVSDHCGALLVQRVGHIALFYRPNPKKKNRIELPRA